MTMLHIRKHPTKESIDEISRVKREQKQLLDRRDSQSAREVFECLDKTIVRESLVKEQHGLCAYCMRRIGNTSATTIEHWQPIEKNTYGAIDYKNMIGVCDGGRKIPSLGDEEVSHILCCDASKGNTEITISPLNSVHMQKIRYSEDGKIYTYPKDKILERDINEVLHLNRENNLDTTTRLLWSRREAYRAYERFIKGLSQSNKLSRSFIEKKIKHMESQDTYDEFAGVVLYYLKRKLRQLQ